MEAMRQTWTDDRMDDLVERVDTGFAQVHELGSELRRENKELAAELRRENKELAREFREENKALAAEFRGETTAMRAELNRRFDALQATIVAAILSGFVGLILSRLA